MRIQPNTLYQIALRTCLIMSSATLLEGRSLRRPPDLTIPVISVKASDPNLAQAWCRTDHPLKIYRLASPFLRINPIKQAFDTDFFINHYLPENQFLSFRNKNGVVNSQCLKQQAQQVVQEIQQGATEFTDFDILKDRDFNYKNLSGLLVLKYKKYPFVLKLAIEHPQTLIDPYSKSFEAKFIFICGGNIRHLSNFTRISNMYKIKKMLSYNPYYLSHIDFPRKWYWKPDNTYNLEITWHASPYRAEEHFSIPSIYAVISDYIDVDCDYAQQELNKISMKIARDTGFSIDPHAGNTVVEKGSSKYTLLDTENFKIMTGLDQGMHATKYIGWFLELSTNCIKIYSFRTKKERIRNCFF